MSINGFIQVLLHKSKEEWTEVIFRLLFTFVTCKLKEHLNFSDTFSYLFHNYDSQVRKYLFNRIQSIIQSK